jgi:hypothetical protein
MAAIRSVELERKQHAQAVVVPATSGLLAEVSATPGVPSVIRTAAIQSQESLGAHTAPVAHQAHRHAAHAKPASTVPTNPRLGPGRGVTPAFIRLTHG